METADESTSRDENDSDSLGSNVEELPRGMPGIAGRGKMKEFC